MVTGKDFLGRGWKFPVKPNAESKLKYVEYETDISEAIMIILRTTPYERLMRPEFGCGISKYVFDVVNTSSIAMITSSIKSAITRYEPRVIVDVVKTDSSRIDEGLLQINISYTVSSTNARANMVYPFYLTEGR